MASAKGAAVPGLILVTVASLALTLFGAGAPSGAVDVFDGNTWLWSDRPGHASRVNGSSGRVDMRQAWPDARGHKVRVVQNDRHLILHDLDTGRVTSVDLARMGVTATLNLGSGSGAALALHEDRLVAMDAGKGIVRGLDPTTLRPTGAMLQFPPPLAGGQFDDAGRLWVGVPSQGTAVAIKFDAGRARVIRTRKVAKAGHDLLLTVLDHGVLVVDRSGQDIVTVTDGVTRRRSPSPLTKATAPSRTVGGLAAVTLPERAEVLALPVPRGGPLTTFAVPERATATPAVPFAGRIYLTEPAADRVHVYEPRGKKVGTLPLPGGGERAEMEVREGRLFVNSPDSDGALVVDPDGSRRPVAKYRQDVPDGAGDGGVPTPSPTPPTVPAPGLPGPAGPPSPAPQPSPAPPPPGNGAKPQPAPSPLERPGAPRNLQVSATGPGELTATWDAAPDNGLPIDGYTATADPGGEQRTSASQHRAVFTDLPNGARVTVTVRAHNTAGYGPAATASGQVGTVPTVEITGTTTGTDRITVDFRVTDDGGMRVTGCRASTDTGASASGDCSRLTIGGLQGGRTYRITVSARNAAGSGVDSTQATTQQPSVSGSVYCVDDGTADPTACDNGVGLYSGPNQSTQPVGRVYHGDRLTPVCAVQGESIYAADYNHQKRSSWWLRLPDGGYIPHAWLNLDNGDDPQQLPGC